MSDDTVFVAADGLATAHLDDEAVLLDVNAGIYYGLNEVGARVMDLLQEPTSLGTLVDVMLTEYEIDREPLRQDLVAFLQAMTAQRLVLAQTAMVT